MHAAACSGPTARAGPLTTEPVRTWDLAEPSKSNVFMQCVPMCSEALPIKFSKTHWPSMTYTKGRILICDTKTILSVDPRTGHHTLGTEFADSRPRFESVNPRTGEVLMVGQGSSASGPVQQWIVVDPDTWKQRPWTVSDAAVPDILLVLGRRGEHVRYHSETRKFDRFAASGEISETVKAPVAVTEALQTTDGIIFCNKTGFHFWHFGTPGTFLLAGHAKSMGELDGFGWRARFGALMRPTYTGGRYIFVRDRPGGSATPASRLVRVDVCTGEVRSLTIENIVLERDFVTMVPVEDELFVLVRKSGFVAATAGGSPAKPSTGVDPLAEDENADLYLLRATMQSESGPDLVRDWRNVDFTEKVRPLVFRLADGSTLEFSGQALAARSVYFRCMLSSSCREAKEYEVDLSNDPDVSRAALEDLLRYVASDSFEAAHPVKEHVFQVMELADRYQLPRLRALVEASICQALDKDNVLSFLGRSFRRHTAIESACWAFLELHGRNILQDNHTVLPILIKENPELAQELMLWTPASHRKKRRMS